ncbi:C1 family peptidase [Sandaracinus amylolyticus]|uniref:C1 family peptidase n=1 Tax=Sandaracinus amylolyticus TaxID=927083 RepID=UPI001F2E21D0|nr:C1 family peptidase [Sandaracinus amylolyticus]UJR85181.1 Hypothetical protein I5071_72610 [Sandaracinus amylolyticus]
MNVGETHRNGRILNCLPSRGTAHDWRIEHADRADPDRAGAPIPPSKDLREPWWTIADQKRTGSCVGWATADSVLRWYFTKAGRLATGQLLSARFIWMAAKESDEFDTHPTTFIEAEGTSIKTALDVARIYGALPEVDLPFENGRLFQEDAEALYSIAARYKIARYHNLGRDPADWRKWLATRGPILTRLLCDETWMHVGPDGVLERYDESSTLGGHAIALVGYEPDCFIVRNTWGRAWGDEGYAYAREAYAMAAFTEAYGVVVY